VARVFSGIQPSGEMHLGNYLGAIRNWVREQEEHDAFFCVVDLHAMTVEYDSSVFADRTLHTAALLLASGVDPDRCTLFVQSQVPQHAELAWILNCVATFGELGRMTQFKDKSVGRDSVSVGLFAYPVLMAADILLYDTDRVPVGDDQRQHLELARDVAARFNHRFGETFVVPEPVIPDVGARIMDLQTPTAKMSKSSLSPQGTLLVTDPPEVTAKKIRSAVTDSGTDVRYDPVDKPGVSNLLTILGAVTGRSAEALEAEFAGAGYGAFKAAVADAVVEFLAPVRDRYETIVADPAQLDDVLSKGADKAAVVATDVLARARRAAGLLSRSQ
jgi:tryptophanyl-tRNA synthetase